MASENNLTAVFTDIANAIRDKKGSVDTIKPINMADEILTISSGGSIKDFITTRNAQFLFYNCTTLTSEQLASILKYDDTSGATNIYYMFCKCTSLTTIPLIDTSNATNMSYMFYSCSNLTSIPQLDTSKATNMSYMFQQCSKLTSIPQLNTSSCTDMSYMFQQCSKLTSIPQLDTSKATNMSYIFYKCINLTSVQQLDTSSCTNMSYMFEECSKLTSIPQLDTSKVTYMSYMFGNCNYLTTIPQLDTSSCTNMSYMFFYCRRLEKIDITKFAGGTSYNNQFANNCNSLKTLIIRTMNTIPTLNSSAFNDCYHFYGTTDATYNPNGLKDGRIYVPDDKVASLKTATNWSVFADIIKPLSEYVE